MTEDRTTKDLWLIERVPMIQQNVEHKVLIFVLKSHWGKLVVISFRIFFWIDIELLQGILNQRSIDMDL